jgi:hypothetical protein
MATLKQKQFTWLSLVLLLVTYTWFGWYLCSLKAPAWVYPACYRLLAGPIPTQSQNLKPAPYTTPSLAEKNPGSTSQSAPPRIENTEQTPHSTPQITESFPPPENLRSSICEAIVKYNLPAGVLAIGWIVVSSMAFISPLTSFSAFISRWFKSDTVAFATLFLLAAGAAIILYWLHIFLQILTILAVDILARIDIQYAGLTGVQAFWILTILSLTGLVLGWSANAMI